MINLFDGSQDPVVIETQKRITQEMVVPKAIKPRHLETGLFAVHIGLEADLPDDGSVYPVYFCNDSGKLKIWNGTSYLSTTLS